MSVSTSSTAAQSPGNGATSTPTAGTAARPRLPYQPALDGVRAVAILAVLAHHSGVGIAAFKSGFYGVDLFFVLSGFLITTLLLEEQAGTGRISLSLFWQRRAARLLPALFAICAALLIVSAVNAFVSVRPILNPDSGHATLVAVAVSLGYVASWAEALAHTTLEPLAHTWSLSVEEWFYAVWPPLLILVLRRTRSVAKAVTALALAALAYRVVSEETISSIQYLYFAPDQRACQLLAGCALGAVLVAYGNRLRRYPRAIAVTGIAGAAGVAAYLAYSGESLSGDRPPYEFLGTPGIALCATAAIGYLMLAPASSLARLLSLRPLVWIGKRSYGLYLYHYPIFALVSPYTASLGGERPKRTFLVAIVLSFLAAAVSYRWLERPAMRWMRKREERLRAASASAPGPEPDVIAAPAAIAELR
jgi:peptidoglycan/LPS O-acetylase OafA/YrhL